MTPRVDTDGTSGVVTRPAPTGFVGNATDLVVEIEIAGAARLPDAVGAGWIDAVRRHAAEVSAGRHEVMIEGAEATTLPYMQDLVADPQLQELLESVARLAYPDGDPADREIDCALRVINGPDPTRRPLWLHYDASVVTMVLPILVPAGPPGQSGELVVCPGRRRYRSSVLINVIEKAVVQSDIYRRRFLRRLRWGVDTETITMTPGNAYLFWGYRSYHANLPCPPGMTRVTVVLHYKNVHGGSRLLARAKQVRALLATQ